jgi:hypothetical protein
MATKRATKSVKRAKKVKSLSVKNTSARKAKNVKGGGGTIEIHDYGFGVSH